MLLLHRNPNAVLRCPRSLFWGPYVAYLYSFVESNVPPWLKNETQLGSPRPNVYRFGEKKH